VEEIRHEDADTTLEDFMLSVFDFFALQVEEIADRTYKLGRAGIVADAFRDYLPEVSPLRLTGPRSAIAKTCNL
jgi:hypothetical protein